MATLDTAGGVTLLELAKQTGDDGQIQRVVPTLATREEFLMDALFTEASGNDSHMFAQQLAEPTGSWTKINEGVAPESARSKQVREQIKSLEGRIRVDQRVIERAPSRDALMRNQETAYLTGMIKNLTESVIYGAAGDTDEMLGLANLPEYDAAADSQVIDAGGGGSDTYSAWLINWDVNNGMYFAYPKGMTMGGGGETSDDQQFLAGLQRQVLGYSDAFDGNNNPYQAYNIHYRFSLARCIGDPRNIVRIASIETAGSSNVLDTDLVIDALALMHDSSNAVLYVPKAGWAQLWKSQDNKANVHYLPETPNQQMVREVMGIPVRVTEQLLLTETAL